MASNIYSNIKRRRISPNMETDETCNMECDSWPLHDAAARGDCDTIKKLVIDKWYLDQLNNMSETPLHLALREHQLSAVRLLVELGADCDLPDRHGERPLELAIDRADPELVKILLREAKVHYNDLVQAFNKKLVDIMDILLSADKSMIDETDENGISLLMRSVMRRDHAFVCLLVRHGCDVNAHDVNESTPLHQAVLLNCINIAEILLIAGANALLLSSTHRSTVHLALLNENDDILKLLLKYGKKESIQCRQQILRVAVKSINVEFSKVIVEHFQDAWTLDVINERDSGGNSPLLSASVAGHHFAVNVLLERGADINFRDRDEHDALYLAVCSGHPETIEIILTKAIDRRFYRRQNVTQLPNMIFLAIAMELSVEIIESLLKHALDEELYETNESNRNILHQALLHERRDVIRRIKTYCGNINTLIDGINSSGQSLISICEEKSYCDVMFLLLPDEFNRIAGDILSRDINEKNVERIKALIEVGVNINESHIKAVIDLESFEHYEPYEVDYELEEGDRLEDTLLGTVIGDNLTFHRMASYYAILKMKYKVVHRLHFKRYLIEPIELEPRMKDFLEYLNCTYRNTSNMNVIYNFFNSHFYKPEILDLHQAILSNFVVFIVEFFRYWSMELNIDETGPTNETLIQIAIRSGNVQAAIVLIQHGANLQMSDRELFQYQRIYMKSFYNLLIEVVAEKKQRVRSLFQLSRMVIWKHFRRFRLVNDIFRACGVLTYKIYTVHRGNTGLSYAIKENGKYGSEIVRELLVEGANPRKIYKHGQTPLIIACTLPNCIDIINMLLTAAPDVVNVSDHYGKTALLYAVEHFESDYLEALIKAGSDLNHVNNNGDSGLHRACAEGRNTNIEMLLKHGANVRQLNNKGQNPLMIAVSTYEINITTIEMLIAAAPDLVNTYDFDGKTALLYGAENLNSGSLKALIESGADLNHVSDNGDTVLHRACARGRNTNIEMLLQHGANVRQLNSKGQTPLMLAAASHDNNTFTVKMLIAAAPDIVNTPDCIGMTALLYAAKKIYSRHLESLIEARADLNHVNDNGDTALHMACAEGRYTNIKMLLKHGANVRQLNKKGQTSLMIATSNPEINISTINMLIAADLDVRKMSV